MNQPYQNLYRALEKDAAFFSTASKVLGGLKNKFNTVSSTAKDALLKTYVKANHTPFMKNPITKKPMALDNIGGGIGPMANRIGMSLNRGAMAGGNGLASHAANFAGNFLHSNAAGLFT